jgi:hypothetical protein
MDALLDIVVPPDASRKLPGAGSLGIAKTVADGLSADPLLGPMVSADLRSMCEAALAQNPRGLAGLTHETGTALVQAQVSANPFFMMGLLRYVYPAYYQHPQVLQGIGEPPRPPFPEGFTVEATDPALLEKLQARRKTG